MTKSVFINSSLHTKVMYNSNNEQQFLIMSYTIIIWVYIIEKFKNQKDIDTLVNRMLNLYLMAECY